MTQKVLIVDHTLSVRQQLNQTLTQAGFTVLEASDGELGLLQVEYHPDLAMVLTEVDMPHMDGLTMLERLKANGARPALPVLMLTAHAPLPLLGRAKRAGARGWIVRPIMPENLVETVRRLTTPAGAYAKGP
jgi:two-component system chemotaxis response regulator CheY